MRAKLFKFKFYKCIALLLFIVFFSSCSHKSAIIVFTQETSSSNTDIYLYDTKNWSLKTLANSSDPEEPCGVTSDGRIVFTKITKYDGGDIYVVNADGTGLKPVLVDYRNSTAICVTKDDHIVFHWTPYPQGLGGNGGENMGYISLDGTNEKDFATKPPHEQYLGITPDMHVIYGLSIFPYESPPLNYGPYDIYAYKIGTFGSYVLEHHVDPTPRNQVIYLGTTSDNKVIYDGGIDGGIYSINADNSHKYVIAKPTPSYKPNYYYRFWFITPQDRIMYSEVENSSSQHIYNAYLANSDGTNPILFKYTPLFEDNYLGATRDHHLIFSRPIRFQHADNDVDQLYSIYDDGNSKAVLLAPVISGSGDRTNRLLTISPSNFIYFATEDRQHQPNAPDNIVTTIHRIQTDGTHLKTLNIGSIDAVTEDGYIIYTKSGNLYIMTEEPKYNVLPRQIAPSPYKENLKFVYYK